MNYFCKVEVIATKDKQKILYIVLDSPKDGKMPEFTQKMLYDNATYHSFIKNNRKKVYSVHYTVYKTEEVVTANLSDEKFEEIIENNSNRFSSGDFHMSYKLEVSKKKRNPVKTIIIAVVSLAVVGILVMGAFKYGSLLTEERMSVVTETEVVTEEDDKTIDGMKIVNQSAEVPDDAEQITISLDRSYSAVPQEDIQLKGTLIDGVAEITLPEFEKSDFFSHVPGYTYGFSTVENSDRIEYYSGHTYQFKADTKLYRVLVKYGGGTGTKEDPYIINYFDQLELMAEEKARGYFKQTCDIEYPEWATHTSIDTVNELKAEPEKELFEYDGGGYTIRNIDNPLFGKISGSLIKNVNISNAHINSPEYKYYGIICCESYNYQYKANSKNYETGETLIKNCSVSDSSIVIKYPVDENSNRVVVTAHEPEVPERVEYDDKGNIVTKSPDEVPPVTLKGDFGIGGITGIGGQIEGCLVKNLMISCDIDKYFLFVGGVSGKPANVIDTLVTDLTVNGRVFTSGGIAGSAGGSRKYNALGETIPDYYGGSIQGCAVVNATLESEYAAGGIAGEGTSSAKGMLISNCYSFRSLINSGTRENGYIKKSGFNGGIIGYDGQQSNGHAIMNCVAQTEYKCIGSASKSKANDTVRLAPEFAYYQNTILNVLNTNSIDANNPSDIFTGTFAIDGNLFVDGNLAYPKSISGMLKKINANNTEEN